MNRTNRTVFSAVVVFCLTVAPAIATEELGKTEGIKCKVCHDKPGSRLLTDKGKYFEYKRTFEGYDQLLRKFKKCTLCHVQEPGNPKLTHSGLELKHREVTMDHLSAPDPKPDPPEKKRN